MNDPTNYSINDLTTRWRVSRVTVWRMRKTAGFPSPIMIRGRPRYPAAEIEKFEQQHRLAAAPASNNDMPEGAGEDHEQ